MPSIQNMSLVVRDLQSFKIRFEFESSIPIRFESDGLIQKFSLSGTVYRLPSSMSDHMLVSFNVFEDWNEESLVLHISVVSFVVNYSLLNCNEY